MPIIRQTSFLSGELAPWLWGRTDSKLYPHGLRTCLNWLPTPQGPVKTRPGTRHIPVTLPGPFYGPILRLIPYIYSDSESYVLAYTQWLTNVTIFIFHDGAQVYDGIYPVSLPTAYSVADVPNIRYAQIGNVLITTIPSDTDGVAGTWKVYFDGTSWTTELFQLRPPDIVGIMPNFTDRSSAIGLVDNPTGYPFTGDPTHPLKYWGWRFTEIGWDENGNLYETRSMQIDNYFDGSTPIFSPLAVPANVNLSPDHPLTFRRVAVLGTPEHERIKAYAYYRGKGSLYGFIGMGFDADFVDYGDEPDYQLQPRPPLDSVEYRPYPFITNKEYISGSWLIHYSWPAAVGFFENRLIFAGSNARPGVVWMSAFGDFINFDEYPLAQPKMPLLFELATRRRERIKHILASSKLFIFTDSSVWTMGGGSQGPVEYNNIVATTIDDVGISDVKPLPIGGNILFVRTKGVGVRQIVPVWNGYTQSFQASDVSYHAIHLFQGDSMLSPTIIDWDFQEDPISVVWAVRSDGVLLSATPGPTGFAWARHETDGVVVSVCCVPEGIEDVVYIVVERDNGTFLERLESHFGSYESGGTIYPHGGTLDSAVAYEKDPGEAFTFAGLDHLEGATVKLYSPGNPTCEMVVASGECSAAIKLEANIGAKVVCFVGLPVVADLETLDVPTQEKAVQKLVKSVGFEVESSRGLWVGEDFDHLTEWRQRSVGDSYSGVSAATEFVKVNVQGGWKSTARGVLRRIDPFPVTLLGVTREIDSGG